MKAELDRKITLMRVHYACFALSSFLIGGWMAVDPGSFWGLFGLEIGEPIIPTVYGSAIVGEGVVCWLGVKRPLRFIPILYYMVAYKLVVCIALVPKLLHMDDAPLAGWLIILAWGSVIVMCGFILPWGRGREVAARLASEVDRPFLP
jgi:hypothetical protein